jgi:hypothetical protein
MDVYHMEIDFSLTYYISVKCCFNFIVVTTQTHHKIEYLFWWKERKYSLRPEKEVHTLSKYACTKTCISV